MRVPRKAISQALFTLLSYTTWLVDSVSTTWATADPRMQLPDDLPADAQPAFFLVKPREQIDQQSWLEPKYKLTYYALIFLRAAGTPEDPNETAEDQLDDILDALEKQLTVRPGEPQTLGGLVTHCFIDGEITIDTPVLFQQCSIWVPITVWVGMFTG